MSKSHDNPHGAPNGRSIVIVARMVDARGAHVRRADIATITYSIFAPSCCHSDPPTAVAGHDGIRLRVGDVFCDSRQTLKRWQVDNAGYNFQHEISLEIAKAILDAHGCYEVRYELSPKIGQRTILRFFLSTSKERATRPVHTAQQRKRRGSKEPGIANAR